ncbi:MAG: tRNA (adenosine(37)-N6)-dimethylallyltransferase MiaA [Methylococcales bacterium]|jgi:tRNA dimethylallyltransferase|nr:tRNA (adenosine(37)-N6)-dimethylallyltransferase MiaA [Methylococcales bacterium]
MESSLPVICLMGPTAAGKTALSVDIAKTFGAEIVSVDSTLVYRGMAIGTAKPTKAEQCGIPHHLLDILDPHQSFSAAEFRTQALLHIKTIQQQGKIPLLTGGTMLYFHALFNGLAELPAADPVVRQRLVDQSERFGSAFMHRKLQQIDPVSALRIHSNDPQRIQRALEVYELTGQPLSHHLVAKNQQRLPFVVLKLVLAPDNRQGLHEKIALRFHAMLANGLVEEVEALFQRGDLTAQHSAMRAVGYRQVWQYLDGQLSYEEMVFKSIVATRQLAKRQFTWLRKIDDTLWFNADNNIKCELYGVLKEYY